MANTIKATNRTIEISLIDSDYVVDPGITIESVVLIPGAVSDQVEIREFDGDIATSPAKTLLKSGDGEPRTQYFKQRLRLGFDFSDSTTIFNDGSKVIFNIGEI